MEADFAAGLYPGRQMLKLAHELETRHGAFTEPLFKRIQREQAMPIFLMLNKVFRSIQVD